MSRMLLRILVFNNRQSVHFLSLMASVHFVGPGLNIGSRLTDGYLYVPYQEIGDRFPDISRQEFAAAVKLVLPNGEAFSGAHAVFQLLCPRCPGKVTLLWLYERVPGFAPVADAGYDRIARQRSFAYQLTKYLSVFP